MNKQDIDALNEAYSGINEMNLQSGIRALSNAGAPKSNILNPADAGMKFGHPKLATSTPKSGPTKYEIDQLTDAAEFAVAVLSEAERSVVGDDIRQRSRYREAIKQLKTALMGVGIPRKSGI